jgi:hypothetical protein
MIRRISLAFLITLLIATTAAATTVRGRVVAADGTPYPSVSVTLGGAPGANKRVFTDRDGMFYVPDVAPGAYTLTVRTSRSERTVSVTATPQPYSDVAPVSVR